MAFKTPQHEIDKIDRQIASDFTAENQDKARAILAPFMDDNIYVADCILRLANGSVDQLRHYGEAAHKDYRDVIYWADYPEESRLDTPEKIDDFQKTAEWLGIGRDAELDELKQQMLQENSEHTSREKKKRWWKIW